jgi:hypothetical protein
MPNALQRSSHGDDKKGSPPNRHRDVEAAPDRNEVDTRVDDSKPNKKNLMWCIKTTFCQVKTLSLICTGIGIMFLCIIYYQSHFDALRIKFKQRKIATQEKISEKYYNSFKITEEQHLRQELIEQQHQQEIAAEQEEKMKKMMRASHSLKRDEHG